MFRKNLILLATVAILAVFVTSTTALVEGKDAARGQFPYYVSLRIQISQRKVMAWG